MAKVLLVEDDNNLREIYEARLQAEGYDITSAQDGEQALVVAKDQKPDLIISDVMMPKISGFEMLDILRNTQGLKDTKVIMLTALGQAEDRGRADSLGADRYLVKSQVTLEDIVKAAHELLEDLPETTPEAAPAAVPDTAPVTPVAAVTPATEIAVSAPPAEPSTGPSPVVTPVVVEVAAEPVASVPVADDNPIVDDAAPATPATDTPSTTQDDTTATVEEPTAPELSIPGITNSVEAPAETAVSEPTPETVTPATELPEVAPTTPELNAPIEAEGTTPEVAAPTDTTAEATTTAEEQATVESQIEDFINSSPAATPTPEVAPEAVQTPAATEPPVQTNDEIMQESVDSLIASAEESNAPLTTGEKPIETRIEPTSTPETPGAPVVTETPNPDSTPEPAPEVKPTPNDDNDAVTIAHKKVLQPINDITSGPDLSELLAREEAKHIENGTAQAVVGAPVTSDNPVVPPVDLQATPAGNEPGAPKSTQPGNTVAPTTTENSIPPTKKDDFDPNNISL